MSARPREAGDEPRDEHDGGKRGQTEQYPVDDRDDVHADLLLLIWDGGTVGRGTVSRGAVDHVAAGQALANLGVAALDVRARELLLTGSQLAPVGDAGYATVGGKHDGTEMVEFDRRRARGEVEDPGGGRARGGEFGGWGVRFS